MPSTWLVFIIVSCEFEKNVFSPIEGFYIHVCIELIVWFKSSISLSVFICIRQSLRRAMLKSPDMMVDLSGPPCNTIKFVLYVLWLCF